VHFAAQAVMSGTQHLVVAGGVEVMSRVPIGSPTKVGVEAGLGHPRAGEGWRRRYGDQEISQFRGAELIAQKWGLSRARLEEYALRSHRRAAAAVDSGLFDEEIAPVAGVSRDEGPRRDTSLERLATLAPLSDGGVLTAGVASQISDGAAALLVASEAAVRRLGLTPMARVRAMTVVGSDPVLMLTGPIPATARILRDTGLALDEIDVYEVNEAFSPVPLAWQAETGADPARTNPLGGAIALGHPLGATGARLMTTMLHHMRRNGLRLGLQTMCEGGGMANATLLERV
jgi:acetyl-CoA C-acetyltransferase